MPSILASDDQCVIVKLVVTQKGRFSFFETILKTDLTQFVYNSPFFFHIYIYIYIYMKERFSQVCLFRSDKNSLWLGSTSRLEPS